MRPDLTAAVDLVRQRVLDLVALYLFGSVARGDEQGESDVDLAFLARHALDGVARWNSTVLNLQRACEASVDLAMHLVRMARLGVPQDSREAFDLLAKSAHLDPDLSNRMQRMVGFRNIAVHDYQAINLDIIRANLHKLVSDLSEFARWGLQSPVGATMSSEW